MWRGILGDNRFRVEDEFVDVFPFRVRRDLVKFSAPFELPCLLVELFNSDFSGFQLTAEPFDGDI